MSEKLSQRDLLLILIAILLALILLVGTGFGFYYLGSKKTGDKTTGGKTDESAQNVVVAPGNESTSDNRTTGSDSSQNTQQMLEGLKGSSGTYDPDKVESQLSSLLSGQNYSTKIDLLSESEVKTSGASTIKNYLDSVENIITGAQTTSISDSALSGLFNGDTSALDAEIAKNQNIYTQLKNVSTPTEAVTIQRKYLTLFKTSIEVMQAEKAMITGGNVDYAVLAKAQGLVSLSKEIDSNIKSLKDKYGL